MTGLDAVRVVAEPLDGPSGARLVEQVQREYVRRYGGRDETPVSAGEFAPPRGTFLVAYVDGHPVACGGLRLVGSGLAEVKRMYVEPASRGRGLARQVLAALEDVARVAGATTVRLETGVAQPEAMALYASSGYTPVETYGHYRRSPSSRCYAKRLASLA